MKSMTAFARTETQYDWGSVRWELRSVNQRYLEIFLKLSEHYKTIEMPARDLIKKQLSRGKVEGALFVELNEGSNSFQVDEALLEQLTEAVGKVQMRLPEATQINPLEILQWPGVLTGGDEKLSFQTLESAILDGLHQTLEQLNTAREREGEALATILHEKINHLYREVAAVKKIYPEALKHHTDTLKQRIQELSGQLEEHRFHQEVAILAQKADITEEIERLETHLKEVERLLSQNGSIGRRLDFLMQELNREANTLGSKAIDSRLAKASVECKVLIEQMREQIQNIE